MKNKILLFTISLLMIGSAIAHGQSTVTLTGHIANAGNLVTVTDFSEFESLKRPDPDRIFTPDSNGNFSITFKLSSPNYFRIARNKLYLSPGDNLKCELDGNAQNKARFYGKGNEANNYLRNVPFPKAASYLNAGKYLEQNPVATLDSIMSLARKSRKELEILTGVTPEFKKMEEVRIKCDIVNSIRGVRGYLIYFNLATRGEGNEDYERTMNAISASVIEDQHIPIDASMMKIEVYRDIADYLIENAPATPEKKKIQDYFTTYKLIKEMDAVSDRGTLSSFSDKLATIQTSVFKQAGEAYLNALKSYGNGDFATDVICISNGLKRISLSSLKGKVIYIDLWATWCGPCLAEMPAYEALKQKYKDNKDIAFVSLSIDDESKYKDWLKNIEERKAAGNQWQVNRNSLNMYNITGIPRTIIIDKNFRIADFNAALPSSKQLPGQLNELLKK